MHWIMRWVMIGLIVSIAGCSTPSNSKTAAAPDSFFVPQRDRFVFHAVLTGLYEDKAPRDIVGKIVQHGGAKDERTDPFFVHKCPICWRVQTAFEAYLASPDPLLAQESRFPQAYKQMLAGNDRQTNLRALNQLVGSYINRHYVRLNMSKQQRDRMQSLIEAGREFGTNQLERNDAARIMFPAACPSCQGALGLQLNTSR